MATPLTSSSLVPREPPLPPALAPEGSCETLPPQAAEKPARTNPKRHPLAIVPIPKSSIRAVSAAGAIRSWPLAHTLTELAQVAFGALEVGKVLAWAVGFP